MTAEQPSIIDDFIPRNPLMAQAWVDCLRWAMVEPDVLNAFLRDTGIVLHPARSPLDWMIDDATGAGADTARKFLVWFNANIWNEGDEI